MTASDRDKPEKPVVYGEHFQTHSEPPGVVSDVAVFRGGTEHRDAGRTDLPWSPTLEEYQKEESEG